MGSPAERPRVDFMPGLPSALYCSGEFFSTLVAKKMANRYDGCDMRATFANIYMGNLRHNIEEVRRRLAPGVRLCIPVKADAYGHGAVPVAHTAVECGSDYLAVAAVSEGVELRKAGITIPILVLSLPQPSEFTEIIERHLTPSLCDSELIRMLNVTATAMGRRVPVHLKVDTGMGRIGCTPEEAPELARLIANSQGVHLDGVFTHFAVSDSLLPADVDYTRRQIETFRQVVDSIRRLGIEPGICHAANSAAVFQYPESHFDMVRPGLVVYGYYPGDITEEYLNSASCRCGGATPTVDADQSPVRLRPMMDVRSSIVAVKQVKKGESISYGRQWVAQEDCQVGVIPAGYGDGLLRRYGESLQVTINGRLYPVVGRICMDQCMICLGTDSSVSRWDEVIIFGPREHGALQSAQDIADRAGTISYEITCGIDQRVPRVYRDE